MKRSIALLLALVMLLSLAACAGKSNSDSTTPSTSTETNGTTESTDTADTSSDEVPDAASLVSDAFIDPINDWDQYNTMIDEIKAETDFAKRTELMHEAEDVLMSNYCIIPLYYYNDIYMLKDYVEGMYANLFGTKFFQNVHMTNGSTTLRLNLASEPDFLDPALNSSVDGACLAAASFSGLYTYNAEGHTEPACATGYTVSEDGLHFVVTLREGLKWSDGSDLTAADFEYSWKRAASEATAADYGYMFAGFEGYPNDLAVTATDDTTLEFTLTAPCAYMEDLMAFPTFYPVKQSAVEAADGWETSPGAWCQNAGFVSNGPFVCTEWNHDTSMTYEKNPYWYGADDVELEKMEFMLSADDTAIYAAYNSGDVDMIDTVPNDEIQSLLSNPEFHIVDNLGTYYAAFNANSAIFEGKTPEQAACMRKAMNILIDREYICENVGQTGQIAANAFIPYGMADGNGGVFKTEVSEQGYFDPYGINNDYEGTLEEARTLLKAAGYKFDDNGMLSSETPISIEYLTNDGTNHIAVAEAMQQDFAALGIEVTIQSQDWNVFLQERKNGNYDFCREGWLADFNDPINMLEMWITTSGNNDCQFGRTAEYYAAQNG